MTDQFILLSGWWAAMTDRIVLLSGWWIAAIFFTLWVLSLLRPARVAEIQIAELKAAIIFAKQQAFADNTVTFLKLFDCRHSKIDEWFPGWPAYRRRKILELTGEAV